MKRVRLVLLLPLLFGDCVANWLFCDGSFRHTMSGEAWRQRGHKYWGWLHGAIDAVWLLLFSISDHCKGAAEKEAKHGSIWAAWAADFKE